MILIFSDLEASTMSETLKKVSDLKQRLEMSLDKYKRLNLNLIPNTHPKKEHGKVHCKFS